MNMHSVDTIHTFPIGSNQTSDALICSVYQQNVPIAFRCMPPMDYALLACFEGLPDGINMELMNVKSWNRSVLRIQSDNQQQLTTIRHAMINKFKYVSYECQSIKNNNNTYISNAENNTYDTIANCKHNDQSRAHYAYSDNDADEDSGNDDYFPYTLSHKTNRFKKDTKQIRKERETRDSKKCKQQNNIKNKTILRKSDKPLPRPFTPTPSPSTSVTSNSNSKSSEQIVSEELHYEPVPPITPITLPPNQQAPSSESDNTYFPQSYNPVTNNQSSSPPKPKPKPNFNFEMKSPNIHNPQQQKMQWQLLPVFDFSFGAKPDNNTVSENRSSMDYLSADPKFTDLQYLSSPPPPPSQQQSFGIKLKYNNGYKAKGPPALPPVLPTFGHSQTQQQYLDFEHCASRQYTEKLKTWPKRENNPKNYFLLPILTNFDYKIGAKIGAKDYGFYSDDGLNNGSLTGKDSNFYYGVDFVINQSKKEKKLCNKTAASFLMEVMQVSKQTNFGWYDNQYYKNGVFQNKFVINNRTIAVGEGRSKAESRQKCSENALNLLRTDANYTNFRNIILRKEAGVKVSNMSELEVGYEFPVVLPPRRYRDFRANYVYQPILAIHGDGKSQTNVHLKRKQSRSVGVRGVNIFMDRGYIGDNTVDNPNVEELYAHNWARFKGEYNIPKHSHEYIDDNGKFIKLLGWKEKALWTVIWNVYDNKVKNRRLPKAVSVTHSKANSNSKSVFSEYKVDGNNQCVRVRGKDRTHFVIYDFDGTVYAQRLYRECSKRKENPHEYICELSYEDIKRIGWKLERIKPLKNHFNALRKCKPGLGVVLHTFHSRESLQKLFGAINMNMSDYFDVVLYHGCEIVNYVNKQKKNGQRYSKERMIQMLCSKYNVLTENVLYVDDDPKVKKAVNCCRVFITQQRNGITAKEMRDIESIIVDQYKLGGRKKANHQRYKQQDCVQNSKKNKKLEDCKDHNINVNVNGYNGYNKNNNNNVNNDAKNGDNGNYIKDIKIKIGDCVSCRNSFPVRQMKSYENVLLCLECYYNNCDSNRMNVRATNQLQYRRNKNNNYQQ